MVSDIKQFTVSWISKHVQVHKQNIIVVTVEVEKRVIEIPKNQKENVSRMHRSRYHLN